MSKPLYVHKKGKKEGGFVICYDTQKSNLGKGARVNCEWQSLTHKGRGGKKKSPCNLSEGRRRRNESKKSPTREELAQPRGKGEGGGEKRSIV